MLNLQIVSDLHIEFNNNDFHDPLNYITPSCDILVMAGDIGNLYQYEQLKDFVNKTCKLFKTVIYVPGNWEFYKLPNYSVISFNKLLNKLFLLKKYNNNLHILNKNSLFINNICIIGCTLWSNLKINFIDYFIRIHGVDSNLYIDKHNQDLTYIKNMINFCNQNNYTLVVITHHTPSYKTLSNYKKNNLSSLYASNLNYLLYKNYIHTWICGHTHKNFDFFSNNNTRIVSNQKGKIKDNIKNFKKNFIIKI